MSVPAKKQSKSRTRRRQAGKGLKAVNLANCKKCGAAKKPHVVCSKCGDYKGKNITGKGIATITKKAIKKKQDNKK